MEFKLKTPLQVHNNDKGEYETIDTVSVSFKGKKGLLELKDLQDVIFKTFQESSSGSKATVKEEEKDKDVTVKQVLDMIEMTGNSAKVFNAVTGAFRRFAFVGKSQLNDDLQDEMSEEDLDGLYTEVLKNFLLEKITRRMNNLKK